MSDGESAPVAAVGRRPGHRSAKLDPTAVGSTTICDNASVGVLITDTADRHLMFRRRRPPVGIAPVAGHIDEHGSAEDAARAEVAEEVGLTVVALTPVLVGWRANACRRPPGPLGHGHRWWLYRAEVTGTVSASPDEARDARWYPHAEVRRLARRTAAYARGAISAAQFAAAPGIEPVWVSFLQALHLVELSDEEVSLVDRLAGRAPSR